MSMTVSEAIAFINSEQPEGIYFNVGAPAFAEGQGLLIISPLDNDEEPQYFSVHIAPYTGPVEL